MAGGGSPNIPITGEPMMARKSPQFSPVVLKDNEASPPVLSTSEAMECFDKYVNYFPEFVFDKICEPNYGPASCIAQKLGMFANRPDFTNDYHFIGIMRCIDLISKPTYKGKIVLKYGTPSASE